MLKHLFLVFSCLFVASTVISAQTLPAGEGGGGSIWIGGGISMFNPDYGCPNTSPFNCGPKSPRLAGPTLYTDLNHFYFRRMGVAGETRFLSWSGPINGMKENTYLVGPKFRLFRFRDFLALNAKIPLGMGQITLPKQYIGSGTYFVYAPGIAADVRVARRIYARADYEYQMWPGFKSARTSFTTGTGGITPSGLSFGVSYAIAH